MTDVHAADDEYEANLLDEYVRVVIQQRGNFR